jgi:hypothetical protein
VNARGAPGKIARVGDLARGGQLDLGDRAVHVEHAVAPDYAALLIDKREPPMMDVVDDAEIAGNMGTTAQTAKIRIAALRVTLMGNILLDRKVYCHGC